MIRDDALLQIRRAKEGITTARLVGELSLRSQPETLAALDVLLALSSELSFHAGKWTAASDDRTGRLIMAIGTYSTTTGRHIFRLASALRGWAAYDYPTEDEIRTALSTTDGQYVLLPNAMIKRTR